VTDTATEQAGTRRLTQFSHGAGCGCKIGPGRLAEILATVTPSTHPDLLVGTETGDDAAVWRLDADRALVATTDFFTPVVDDPRTWGRIAATNAVSDVYAMGGRPLFALNVVAWPSEVLPPEMLGEVLAGGADVGRECGFAVVGGHSIDDPEPKYGLAVVGEVHPDRILTNAGLRPGDALVLTKPIGSGVLSTAVKRGELHGAQYQALVETMCALNAQASRAALDVGVRCATDVTGFGLLGHAVELGSRSGVRLAIDADALPALPGAIELASDGVRTGGDRRNREFAGPHVESRASEAAEALAYDPQTSGGLLVSMPNERAPVLEATLASEGLAAARIGRVEEGAGVVLG
jgi:selenide,water dikinase